MTEATPDDSRNATQINTQPSSEVDKQVHRNWNLPDWTDALAGAAAAATSTVVGGQLGVAGTVIGAGIASIVATLALTVYKNVAHTGHQALRQAHGRITAKSRRALAGSDQVLAAGPRGMVIGSGPALALTYAGTTASPDRIMAGSIGVADTAKNAPASSSEVASAAHIGKAASDADQALDRPSRALPVDTGQAATSPETRLAEEGTPDAAETHPEQDDPPRRATTSRRRWLITAILTALLAAIGGLAVVIGLQHSTGTTLNPGNAQLQRQVEKVLPGGSQPTTQTTSAQPSAERSASSAPPSASPSVSTQSSGAASSTATGSTSPGGAETSPPTSTAPTASTQPTTGVAASLAPVPTHQATAAAT